MMKYGPPLMYVGLHFRIMYIKMSLFTFMGASSQLQL